MSTSERGGRRESSTESDVTGGFLAAQQRLFAAYDVDVRSREVDLETTPVRLHAFESERHGDRPLVFVHGTAAFGAVLSPLLGEFQNRWVVGFDRPGYGQSAPYVYEPSTLRQTLVDSLAAVLATIDADRVDLVGHSAGGHAVLRFAQAHPDRVGRIVTIGAVPGFPGTRPPIELRLLTVPVLNRLVRRLQPAGEAGVLQFAGIFGEREAARERPAWVQAIAAHEAIPTAATAGFSEVNALLSMRGWRRPARITAGDLAAIDAPTTAIWGERDPLGRPAAVRPAIESMPRGRLVTIEGAHIPFLGRPRECGALVRAGLDRDIHPES